MSDSGPQAARPRMPASYGLADADAGAGLLPWSWADERLATARNYWLATAGPDGRPQASPIWGVWRDGGFYFGTDGASRKARNLAVSPYVSLHLESGDEVVIVEGTVATEDDDAVVAEVVAAYRVKYRLGDDFSLDPCLRVRSRVALGWLETDFPATATRWAFV